MSVPAAFRNAAFHAAQPAAHTSFLNGQPIQAPATWDDAGSSSTIPTDMWSQFQLPTPSAPSTSGSSFALPASALGLSIPELQPVPRVLGHIVGGPPPNVLQLPQVSRGRHPVPFSLPASSPLSTATSYSSESYVKKGKKGDGRGEKFSLRMRNLPQGIKSNEVWEAYEYQGVHTIADVYLPPNKPFGFLRFGAESDGLAALNTKIVLHGVTIDLELATGNKRSSDEMALISPEERLHKELQERWQAEAQKQKEGRRRDDDDDYDDDEREARRKRRKRELEAAAEEETVRRQLREQLQEQHQANQLKLAQLEQQVAENDRRIEEQGGNDEDENQQLRLQLQLHMLQQKMMKDQSNARPWKE